MALPMDEQRILDEMERMLAAEDPRLAARLASFGQPGLGHALRTGRGRVTLSLMVLALVAAVAIVLYMMSAFRLNGAPGAPARPGPTHSHGAFNPRGTYQPETWRPSQAGMVQLVGPSCAATMLPRECTAWALAAARRK